MKEDSAQKKSGHDRRSVLAGLAATLLAPGGRALAAPENAADDAKWFDSKLGAIKQEDLAKMTQMVLKNAVPLTLQVQFLKETLQKEGHYYTLLHHPKLSESQLGVILQLNEKVSTDMTNAYAKKDVILNDPLLQAYFDEREIEKVKAATRRNQARLLSSTEQAPTSSYYNEFLFTNNDEIYVATARHVLQKAVLQGGWEYGEDGSDAAVRYIPPSTYKEFRIEKATDLPKHGGLISSDRASGHVAFSFGKDIWGKEHAHFSIAMPLPWRVRKFLYGENVDEKHPGLKHAMMFVRPVEAAKLIQRTAEVEAHLGKDADMPTAVQTISGSGVFIRTTDGYEPIGPFTGSSKLTLECRKYCQAVSTFVDPNYFSRLVARNQTARVKRSLRATP